MLRRALAVGCAAARIGVYRRRAAGRAPLHHAAGSHGPDERTISPADITPTRAGHVLAPLR